MCGRSLEQNLGGWLLFAEEAGRLSYQTQSDGAVRSGRYLFLSTRYLVANFPRARTFRNFLVNISIYACLVNMFVQFLLAICSPKVW